MSHPPSVYVTDHATSVLRTHNWRTASNSASYFLTLLKPSMTILDVGCGPGSISIDLARLVPSGHVTGIDVPSGHVTGIDVPSAISSARASATAQGITNIDFQEGDVHALDFPDNSFDIVHAHQVLQHVADPVAALREMRRVAKPGGFVAARESASMSWYPESAGLTAWLELFSRVARAKGGNPHPGSRIHCWAREAGFERLAIKCSAGSWCFRSDEEREYWGGSMAERMLESGFARQAVEGGHASMTELEGIARAWRGFVEDEDAWFGVMHGEIICSVWPVD